MVRFGLHIGLCLLATAAAGQTFDERSARAEMFSTKGYGIQVSGGLSEKDRATVQALIPIMGKETGQGVRYYTSIAYAPDQGLVSEALQGAVNFHSPSAADAAALAACETNRRGGRPCAIAARVVPKNYERRALTLSVDATEALQGDYRRSRSPKALAISPTSGAWGIGRGDQAAIAACADNKERPRDCRVVVRD